MGRSRAGSAQLRRLVLPLFVSCAICTFLMLLLVALAERSVRSRGNNNNIKPPMADAVARDVTVTSSAAHLEMHESQLVQQQQQQPVADATRKIYMERSKMQLKPPFFPHSNRDQGWMVLPGNVVVHRGVANNEHRFAYVLNAAERPCATLNLQRVSALIFVESDARHVERRLAIRETWALSALQEALNFRVVFILGIAPISTERNIAPTTPIDDQILQEHYTYGDIVQENFTESFRNLGHKSVMGLQWATHYCPQADYVMKTDDDILVHAANLLRALEDQPRRGGLLCRRNRSRQIIRDMKAGYSLMKYRVPTYDLPGSYFPEYCGGFGYIMSRDVAQSLLGAAETTPYFFIEDAFVTGICREKAGVTLRELQGVLLKPEVTEEQAACVFALGEGRITSHELKSEEEIRALWRGINTQGFFCPVLLGLHGKV